MFHAASGQGASNYPMLLIMGAMAVGIYFLMFRPQQKRRREIEAMQSGLGPGDEIVTVGGLYGIVQSVEDDSVRLEIAPGVVTRYARGAISKVVTAAPRDDDGDGDDEPASKSTESN